MAERVLLDTCAIIWASQDEPFAEEAVAAIEATREEGGALCVSPISAWEIGLLMARGKLRSSRPPLQWFEEFAAAVGADLISLSPAILVNSSYLPGEIHGDPVDRILISTARDAGLTLVTRDRAILRYGQDGYVSVAKC